MTVLSHKPETIARIDASEIWRIPPEERKQMDHNNDRRILSIKDDIAQYLLCIYKGDCTAEKSVYVVDGVETANIISKVISNYSAEYQDENGNQIPPSHLIHNLCAKRHIYQKRDDERKETTPFKFKEKDRICISHIYKFCEKSNIYIENIKDKDINIIAEHLHLTPKKVKDLLNIAYIVNSSNANARFSPDEDEDSEDEILRVKDSSEGVEDIVLNRTSVEKIVIAVTLILSGSKRKKWDTFFSHTIIYSIRLKNLLAELLPVENDCWPVMNAEYILFVVENADTFYTIQSNRLLKQLQDKTMAEFCGCSKENISIGLKEYRHTIGNVLRMKEE